MLLITSYSNFITCFYFAHTVLLNKKKCEFLQFPGLHFVSGSIPGPSLVKAPGWPEADGLKLVPVSPESGALE